MSRRTTVNCEGVLPTEHSSLMLASPYFVKIFVSEGDKIPLFNKAPVAQIQARFVQRIPGTKLLMSCLAVQYLNINLNRANPGDFSRNWVNTSFSV